MGKAALFIALAAILAGSMMLYQSGVVSQESDHRQSERESLLIAREIARSGYEAAKSIALETQSGHPSWKVENIVSQVNGTDSLKANIQGGNYVAWLEKASESSYKIYSRGTYNGISHVMMNANSVASATVKRETLETPDSVKVKITFIESTAGYCSAIYLQAVPPRTNNGHGNNVDGVDCSNPGKSILKRAVDTNPLLDDEQKGEAACLPMMVFPPGHNRNGMSKVFEKTVPKGWRLNFKLAVNQSCSREGSTTIAVTDRAFNYVRDAMRSNVSDLSEMNEGEYVLIQQHPTNQQYYRLAFEDMIFDTRQLADVKKNSYGSLPWSTKKKTYGGTGWFTFDALGYFKLGEFGDRPDFNDQVIQVQLIPAATYVAGQ